MKHYEVNFIIDPVLSGDEIKATAKVYESLLKDNDCQIVHVNEMGLKQLAYAINKRTSGVYYCIEFAGLSGAVVSKLELALRRDERIIRHLTVALDKYGIKYNEDRRTGKITSYKKKEKKKTESSEPAQATQQPAAPAPAPTPAPAPAPAPVVVANEEE